jgi:hypothetical protein
MRTKIMRLVPAIVATTVSTLAMTAVPAQAHAFRVGTEVVFADLSANHAHLDICRILGSGPGVGAWATVRYRNPSGPGESLVRYDAPNRAGVCVGGGLGANVNAVRACHSYSPGNNYCTAWRLA